MRNNAGFRVICSRAVFIGLFCFAAGLAFNAVSPRGIPYIFRQPHSVVLSSGQARLIEVEEAYALFQKGEAVFIDTRTTDHFRRGHIKGALSLPAYDADSNLDVILSSVSPDKMLVAYCHGAECDESREVADILMQMGYKNMLIFASGFPAWRLAGFPVETGDGRLL